MKNPVRAQPVRVNRFTDSQHHDIVRPLHTLDATLDMFHARNGKYRDPKRSHDYDLRVMNWGTVTSPGPTFGRSAPSSFPTALKTCSGLIKRMQSSVPRGQRTPP